MTDSIADAAPSTDDCGQALLDLFPPGRAWQHGVGAVHREDSVFKRVVWALAAVWQAYEVACLAMIEEFFCATAAETLDLWNADYGLPSDCDPWGADICAKAGAAGGVGLDYYITRAAALGYVTEMRWLDGDDPEFSGITATLHVTIDSAASAALPVEVDVETAELPDIELGTFDAAPLLCALDGVVPAHYDITYTII